MDGPAGVADVTSTAGPEPFWWRLLFRYGGGKILGGGDNIPGSPLSHYQGRLSDEFEAF